jgi:FkbM family methyltransferase
MRIKHLLSRSKACWNIYNYVDTFIPVRKWRRAFRAIMKVRTGKSVLTHFHHYRHNLVDQNNRFRWQDITLCVQNDYHANILLEDYLENGDYNFLTNRPTVVLDIGANIGDTPLYFAQRANVRKIYAYEPMPKTYAIAKANLELNPKYAPKIHLENAGLGDKNETIFLPFDYPAGNGSASTVVINQAHQDYLNTFFPDSVLNNKGETIHIRNASEVLRAIRRSHPHDFLFLKCDCEGAEWAIFKTWEDDYLLKEIDAISMEFHHASPLTLLESLQNNGFVCFLRERENMIMAVRS